MWLAEFLNLARFERDTIAQVRRHGGLLIYKHHGNPWPVADVVGAVVGDIQIERAIAIDISKRHRLGGIRTDGASLRGRVGKAAAAGVQEAEESLTDCAHQKIK